MEISELEYNIFCNIKAKYIRAMERHGKNSPHSLHEGLGVVTEEYHELIDAVRNNDFNSYQEELYDLIVASIWALTKQ